MIYYHEVSSNDSKYHELYMKEQNKLTDATSRPDAKWNVHAGLNFVFILVIESFWVEFFRR